ncbi:MAG: transcriptional repressor [Chloroflexi bacterium]|nr:transcriptional repressor [Chloroflexota bacterium]
MAGTKQALESLKEVGYRLTPQRMLVLSAIQEGGHLSAEEVYGRVKEEYAFIDIATVYRTLALLKRLRLVTETELGDGPARYELSTEPHHHLVCRGCGETTPLNDDLFAPLRLTLRERLGFEAELEHLPVFGICSRCGAQGRRAERRRAGVATERAGTAQ